MVSICYLFLLPYFREEAWRKFLINQADGLRRKYDNKHGQGPRSKFLSVCVCVCVCVCVGGGGAKEQRVDEIFFLCGRGGGMLGNFHLIYLK